MLFGLPSRKHGAYPRSRGSFRIGEQANPPVGVGGGKQDVQERISCPDRGVSDFQARLFGKLPQDVRTFCSLDSGSETILLEPS